MTRPVPNFDIFVTVGTTKFEALIKVVDFLVGAGRIKKKVVAQIGSGRYIPKNIDYFRWAPSLNPYYKKAKIVISHGGHGTLFEVIKRGLRTIGASNPAVLDDHQTQILRKLDSQNHLLWCSDLSKLDVLIESKRKLKKFTPTKAPIFDKLFAYI